MAGVAGAAVGLAALGQWVGVNPALVPPPLAGYRSHPNGRYLEVQGLNGWRRPTPRDGGRYTRHMVPFFCRPFQKDIGPNVRIGFRHTMSQVPGYLDNNGNPVVIGQPYVLVCECLPIPGSALYQQFRLAGFLSLNIRDAGGRRLDTFVMIGPLPTDRVRLTKALFYDHVHCPQVSPVFPYPSDWRNLPNPLNTSHRCSDPECYRLTHLILEHPVINSAREGCIGGDGCYHRRGAIWLPAALHFGGPQVPDRTSCLWPGHSLSTLAGYRAPGDMVRYSST